MPSFTARCSPALFALATLALLTGAASAQPGGTKFDFDIPPQPLAHTVNHIGQITGTSVLIEGEGDDLTSPPLEGSMTIDAALQSVLRDSRGRYRFTAQGSLVVELPARTRATTPAEGETVTLDTVVVTASGYVQQLTDAPATMTVIRGEDLTARPITDALRDVPGLSVGISGRDGGTPITLRGMGQPYVLFMVDGKPLSASEEAAYNGNGTGSKSGFLPPAAAIDRIEVIRGPMSALYGSAALGSVVNVITRPVPESRSGNADLRLTPDTGSTKARFMYGGPLIRDRLGLMLYGGRSDRQGRLPPDGSALRRGHSERVNLGGRLSWNLTKDQSLDLDLWRSRQRFEHGAGGGRIRDNGTSLTHRIRWDAGAETVSFLFRETTDFDADYQSGHDALTFSTRSSLPWGPNHLTFGFEHRHERTRHDPDRLPDSVIVSPERWHQALYGEGRFMLSPDAMLTLGLRYDRSERYAAQLTPRLYAVWHPLPGLTLKGGIGSGYRVPALKQADDDVWEPSGGDGRSRDRGNSALKPEQSTNYELGLVWEAQNGFQIGATGFHTRFRNRISRMDLCRTPAGQAPSCELNGTHHVAVTQYVNEDAATLEGVELTFDLPLDEMRVSANYTWSNSRITSGVNAGRAFHNLPRHMLNLGLNWQADEALEFWSRARFRSRSETLGRSAGRPSHLTVDLGVNHRIGKAITASLGLNNIRDVVMADDPFAEGRRLYLGLGGRF